MRLRSEKALHLQRAQEPCRNQFTGVDVGAAKKDMLFGATRHRLRRRPIDADIRRVGHRDAAPQAAQEAARIVRIRDTLSLIQLEVSEAMTGEVNRHPQLVAAGEPVELTFDTEGNLRNLPPGADRR